MYSTIFKYFSSVFSASGSDFKKSAILIPTRILNSSGVNRGGGI